MRRLLTLLLLVCLGGTVGLFLYPGQPVARDRRPLPAPIEQICCVTPGNVFVSIAGAMGESAVWNMRTCERIAILQGFPSAIVSLAQSLDGRRLYACAEPRTIQGWEIATGKQCFRVALKSDKAPFDGKIFHVPSGEELIVADSLRLVRINLSSKEPPTYLNLDFLSEPPPDLENDGQTPDRTGPGPHCEFFFGTDNSFKCVIQMDDRMDVWDIFSKKKERTFSGLGNSSGIHCFAVTTNGQVLVTCDPQNGFRKWSMAEGVKLGSHPLPLDVHLLVPSPNGRFAVAQCFDDLAPARSLRSINRTWASELGARLPDDAENVLFDSQTGITYSGLPYTGLSMEKRAARHTDCVCPLVGFLENDGLLVIFTEEGVSYWDLPPVLRKSRSRAWMALAATLVVLGVRLRLGRHHASSKAPFAWNLFKQPRSKQGPPV